MKEKEDIGLVELIKVKRYLRVQIEKCKRRKIDIIDRKISGDIKEIDMRISIYKEVLDNLEVVDKLDTTLQSSMYYEMV